ncbi:protein OS-9-like [Ptychodera flava]|uniref:protein OS-9-like n=1 Tax=Ptychodera flava TaxID=63121 RepID=UPI003969FA64
MATAVGKLSLLTAVVFSLNFALFCAQLNSFLDLEEIDDVKYGIDIANTPVLMGRPLKTDVVYMKSRHGQEYECQLPEMSLYEKQQDEDKENADTSIPELLKPLEDKSCLVKTKHWWTYEYCHGKEIKQYHLEDGNIVGDTIYLGYFDSEFDWKNHSNTELKRHKAGRYHSQLYKNGSVCDITGKQREAEVRFLCSEDTEDTISRVDEPSSCTYLLTIHTNRLCKHPHLRLPPTHKPRPILCFPALNHDQYAKYLDKKDDEEYEREQRMKAIEEVLAKHEAETERTERLLAAAKQEVHEESHDIIVSKKDLLNTISSKIQSVSQVVTTFGKEFLEKEMEKTEENTLDEAVEYLFELSYDIDKLAEDFLSRETHKSLKLLGDKLIETADELHSLASSIHNKRDKNISKRSFERLAKLYKEIFSMHALLTQVGDDKFEDIKQGDVLEDGLQIDLELEMDIQDDEDIKTWLSSFAETLKNVESKLVNLEGSSSAKSSKSDADTTVRGTSDDAADEVAIGDDDEDSDDESTEREEDEILKEDEEYDDDAAMKEFSDGLAHIIPDETQREKAAAMSEEIKESVLQQFDDILTEAKEEFGGDDSLFDDMDQREAAQKLAKTLNKLIDSLKNREEKHDSSSADKKQSTSTNKKSKQDILLEDDDDDDDDEEEEDDYDDTVDNLGDEDDDRVRVRVTKINIAGKTVETESEIYDSKYKKIEKAVEEHLENAGINPDGKIEVKIISYDPHEDDSGVTVLSEEESSYFKNMIVGILGGGKESSQEEQRQQRLEENYNLVWSESDSTYHQRSEDNE